MQFSNGYQFRKLDVRGKVFIEYVPIELAWLPLQGESVMVVNCFWVSGRFKGNGYGKQLLGQAIKDAKEAGMKGVVAITSDRKRPFMSDPVFYERQGFKIVDTAPPFFRLYGYSFTGVDLEVENLPTAKLGDCPDNGGITAYYSNTCPFTEHYTGTVLPAYAEKYGLPITLHHLKSREEAHQVPIPWVINSVFFRGKLISLEMKVDRYLDPLVLGKSK